jgi:hypothetical protein
VSYFASCAGLQVVSGSLMIPLVGAWTADLSLASDQPVTGQVAVVIGNLTLLGTVYRSDVYGGQVHARIVGGYGGWRTQAPPQGYGSGTGLMLSTVLSDLAGTVGEQLNVVADTNIGSAFARVNFGSSVASDVLWQFVRLGFMPGWYIDPAGVTQTSTWPETQITTPFMPTDQRPDEGVIEIATEDYASWMPGCVFSSPLLAASYTSAGVLYTWGGDGKFRFQVLTKTADSEGDRLLGPLQQVIQKEIAPHRFFGRYEYVISNPQPTTIDGAPVDTELGLPELQMVPLVGDAIASYTPPDGGKAHVMFLDGSPAKPVCVWTEVGAQNGPTAVTLAPQGDGANNVARVTDTVVVLFPPLLQVAGIISGAPFVGVLTITTPAVGAIQTGSSLVQATQG